MDEKKRTVRVVFISKEDQSVLSKWWHWLENNRGERAKLRRCGSPEEVMSQSAFHRLYQQLSGGNQNRLLEFAAIAGLLSQVSELDEMRSMATRLGMPKVEGGDKPLMSELRLQQLLASEDLNELFDRMRRAIQLLNRRANILSIADGVLNWSKDQRTTHANQPRDKFQYQWAKAYFGNFQYHKES